ncbi:hypothetical protein BH10ACT7_BH10ACT7_32170 [soil metagenome]
MKRSTRSIAAVVATAALTATALSGCTGGTPAADSNNLTIAYWNYGEGAVTQNEALADGFVERNPEAEITLLPIAGDNWGGYLANLATTIASGEKPDIAFTASEGVKFLSQNGLIVPINEYLETDPDAQAIEDDIAPALLQSFAVGDDIAALPNGWNNMVVYYNTAAFDAAGVAYPEEGWTWADFKETAAALTKDTTGDGVADQYGFSWASNEIFPGILPWVANADGNLVSDDVCEATADSAPVVEAVTYLNDLIAEGSAPAPAPMGDIFTRFQSGQIAMFGAGRWPSATFLPAGFTDWDIALYPEGATYQTVVGAAGYAVLTSAENPDLGWEFQKYTASAEIQDSLIGTPEAPRDGIPTLRSTAQKTVDAGIPPLHGNLFYESVDDFPALTPFPAPAKYSEYESTVLRHTQLIFGGEVSVEEGLANLQTDLSAIVTC